MTRDSGRTVVAIDGPWEPGLEHTSNIRPVLDLLAATTDLRVVHRHAETPELLQAHLDLWCEMESAAVLHLAFHGSRGKLWFHGDRHMSLEELGEIIDGRADGDAIHLGGCSVVRLGTDRLQTFRKATGSSVVTGYTRNVDPSEAAAFEALVLSWLAVGGPGDAITHIRNQYPDLVARLGFVAIR